MLLVSYRIAGNFDGGNFDVFEAFQPDRQNLTCQIFKSIQCLVKDSDHPSKYFVSNICRVSIRQNSPRQNFPLYGISGSCDENKPIMKLDVGASRVCRR